MARKSATTENAVLEEATMPSPDTSESVQSEPAVPETPVLAPNAAVIAKVSEPVADEPLQAAPDAPEAPEDDEDYIDSAELDKLRQQAEQAQTFQQQLANLQKNLKEAQKRVKDFEREKLSEEQRKEQDYQEAQHKLSTLTQQLHNERAKNALIVKAQEMKINPDLAVKLAVNDVTFDDDGTPVNVETILKTYAKQFPAIVEKPAVVVTATNPQKAQNRDNRPLTRDDVMRMSETEINTRWSEVQQVLAS